MHLFTCACGESFAVSPRQAGQSAECPVCHETSNLPKLREIKALPVAEASEAEASTGSRAGSSWSVGRGFLFSVILLGLLVSAGVACFSTYKWQTTPKQMSRQEIIESGQDGLNTLNAPSLFQFWIDYGASGMGPRTVPAFEKIQRERDSWQKWSLTTYGISAALFLGLVGIIRTKK